MTAIPLARPGISPRHVAAALLILIVSALVTVAAFVGLRILHMDIADFFNSVNGIVLGLGALASAVGGIWYRQSRQIAANLEASQRHELDIAKLNAKQIEKDLRDEINWRGQVARGFAEAVNKKHLIKTQGADGRITYLVSTDARAAFGPLTLDLRELALGMVVDGKSPTIEQLVWEIEANYQQWLFGNICEPLGVHGMGCTAIASVLARESGSLMVSLTASAAHPNESPTKPA